MHFQKWFKEADFKRLIAVKLLDLLWMKSYELSVIGGVIRQLEGGLLNEEDGKINKAIVAVLTDNGHTAMA